MILGGHYDNLVFRGGLEHCCLFCLQFGGLKVNSISHYLIELLNFILYNQHYKLPIGVLACTVDFSKAFNRQNHNILIVKISDMGVPGQPGWLLNIIMGFLSNRIMVVREAAKNILRGGLLQSCALRSQNADPPYFLSKGYGPPLNHIIM